MAIRTIEDVLFPGIGVRVGNVNESSGTLLVEAEAVGKPGRCPDCRSSAGRVHSTYQRTLDERPLGPRQVIVRLRVRRFFCDRQSCTRRTFAEQVAGLTERCRRVSLGLKNRLHAVAAELGGRPGARLCRKVQLKGGRTLLLGLLQAPPVPRGRHGCSGWTTSRCDAEPGTRPYSSTSRQAGWWTCCPTARRKHLPTG